MAGKKSARRNMLDRWGKAAGNKADDRVVTRRYHAARDARRLSMSKSDAAKCPSDAHAGKVSVAGPMTVASVLDMEALQQIQDALADATGLSWELVDPEGQPIMRPSGSQRLCELVRAEPAERARCVSTTRLAGRRAVEQQGPARSRCDACGLVCIVAPILVEGRHLASWHCGQVRLGEPEPAMLDRLEASCAVDRTVIARLFQQAPLVDPAKFDAISSLAWHHAKALSNQAHMTLQLRRDVSARRQAEAFLDEIINALSEPVFVKDRQHRFVTVNRALCELLGHVREELLGKSDPDFFPAEQARVFWEKDDEVFSTGQPCVNEELLTDASGTTRVIVTTKTMFRRADGSSYLVGVIRDVTGQRRDEQELARYRSRLEELVSARTRELLAANEKLMREIDERKRAEEGKRQAEAQLVHQQKLEAIGRLAGGVAHDFNNLLTGILGHVSLALREAPSEGRVFDSLNEIRNAARRAGDLTRQLLAFSRKQVIEPRPVDLSQLIGNLHKLLSRIIGEDVRLEIDLHPSLPAVRVDPGQIEQVIVNLAVNARDAMPQGGSLRITTSLAAVAHERQAQPPVARPGEYVRLTVSDTGVGMDEQTRDRIFEPFFTTKQGGTGLGLSMVYGIVQQHDGFIDVISEPGRGSSFLVYLPVMRGEVEPKTQPVSSSNLPVGTETILLVEDEPIVREVSRLLLTQLGYRVLVASDGAQALALSDAETGPIDLLITDIVMPGMDGRELAATLTRRRPSLRVLFTSGYTEDVIVRRGVLEQGVDFLAKPFARELLAARVREILDRP